MTHDRILKMFRKRCFPALVWTWIFLKNDKKKLRFQTKADTCGQALADGRMPKTRRPTETPQNNCRSELEKQIIVAAASGAAEGVGQGGG